MNKRYVFLASLAALLSKGCTVRESLELLRGCKTGASVSNTASRILEDLNRGKHLAEILAGKSIPGVTPIRPYLGLLERTGSILPALTLTLADGKRREEYAARMIESLFYPLFVTVLLSALLALLFAIGIPWMSRSNLLPDSSVIPEMKRGVIASASFLGCSTGAAAFFSLRLLARKNGEYLFWSLLDCFTEAGLTFDQALALCAREAPVPYSTDGNGYFFDAPGLDLFTRSALHSLRLTGDCRSAFASIAAHKKESLDELHALLSKTAEPLLLLITGIVLLILALTVFIPALTQNGGFI